MNDRKRATAKDLDDLHARMKRVDKTGDMIGRRYPSIRAAENSIPWLKRRRRWTR